MAHLELSTIVPASRGEVFDYLADPNNMPEMLKGHIDVIVETPNMPVKKGSEFQFSMTRFGMTQRVRLKIEDFVKSSRLSYRQSEGIFDMWLHVILLEEKAPRETIVTDLIDYQLPLGLLGHLADDLFVRRDMQSMLECRIKVATERLTKTEATTSTAEKS